MRSSTSGRPIGALHRVDRAPPSNLYASRPAQLGGGRHANQQVKVRRVATTAEQRPLTTFAAQQMKHQLRPAMYPLQEHCDSHIVVDVNRDGKKSTAASERFWAGYRATIDQPH